MTSQKCQVCNNVTTNPSGRCYLHQSMAISSGPNRISSGVPTTVIDESLDDQHQRLSDRINKLIGLEQTGWYLDPSVWTKAQMELFLFRREHPQYAREYNEWDTPPPEPLPEPTPLTLGQKIRNWIDRYIP